MKFRILYKYSLFVLIILISFIAKLEAADSVYIKDIEEEYLAIQMVKNDSLRIEKYIALSRKIHKEYHNDTLEYKFADLAIEESINYKNGLLYTKSLDNLGLLYRFHNLYSQSIPLHTKAYNFLHEIISKNEYKNTDSLYGYLYRYANNIGVAARYNEQFYLAASYYYKVINKQDKFKDERNLAIAYNGLAITLMHIPGKEDEAITYFLEAKNIADKANNKLGVAMNLLSISHFYIENNDFDKALENINELYKINTELKDSFGIAVSIESYGRLYNKKEKNSLKAKNYFKEALTIYKSLGKYNNVAEIYAQLGSLYLKNKEYNLAENNYKHAIKYAEKQLNFSILKGLYDSLSLLEEKRYNYDKALKYYKLANNYEDSLNIFKQKLEILGLERQFDFEKMEIKISLLEHERNSHEKQALLQKNKLRISQIIIIISLIFLCFLLVFFFLYNKRKNQARKAFTQLKEKEKELLKAEYEISISQAEIQISRLQINPHFIFNSLNAIKLLIQKNENKIAQNYLTSFSRYIRRILELPQKETISLFEELELIKEYINIERKRFHDAFYFEIYVDKEIDVHHIVIPPLLLQPFVENAIWHGLLPLESRAKELKILISKNDDGFSISIRDNGVGRKIKENKNWVFSKKSMGLKITKDRIKQFNSYSNLEIDFQILDKIEGTEVLLNFLNKNKDEEDKNRNII